MIFGFTEKGESLAKKTLVVDKREMKEVYMRLTIVLGGRARSCDILRHKKFLTHDSHWHYYHFARTQILYPFFTQPQRFV